MRVEFSRATELGGETTFGRINDEAPRRERGASSLGVRIHTSREVSRIQNRWIGTSIYVRFVGLDSSLSTDAPVGETHTQEDTFVAANAVDDHSMEDG